MTTIAQVFDKFVAAYPGISNSQRSCYQRIGRSTLGQRNAKKLTPQHFIDFFAARGKTVAPSTNSNDVSAIKGALGYAAIGLGMDGVSADALIKAMPVLKQRRLVGSSNQRDRVPTPEEHAAILADASSTNPLNAEAIDFQYESARRIGETSCLLWSDYSKDRTILVRDMKHPRKKMGHTKRLVVLDRAAEIIERQPRLTTSPEERIFKVNPKSVGQAFRRSCDALGIEGLHLHDYRAGVVTRMVIADYTPQQILLVTGHDSIDMVMRVYTRLKAEDFKRRPI